MATNRLRIKDIMSTFPVNEKGNHKITIESLFFYEGISHEDGKYPKTNARLIDYVGDDAPATIFDNSWKISPLFDYEDKFVAIVTGYRSYFKDTITIETITPVPPSDPNYKELMKVYLDYKQKLSPEQKDEYVTELIELISEVQNKYYRALLENLLNADTIEKIS